MEDLISAVQKRNVLWNRDNYRNKDRMTIDNEWTAVARTVGISRVEAKKKWRSLRDQFAKELKKNTQDNGLIYSGKWRYFRNLFFLKDTIIPRKCGERRMSAALNNSAPAFEAYNEETINDTNQQEIILTDSCSSVKNESPPPLKRSKMENEEENPLELNLLEIQTKKLAPHEEAEDQNSLFLRSLIPFMRKLDPIRQLRVRTKFESILLEELETL